MHFVALAADYDGTLATNGSIDAATVAALRRLRDSGRRLLMVTGRELDELKQVCPHLALFDRVVAENGGLIYKPKTDEVVLLTDAPSPEFVDALRLGGCERVAVGRSIVATWEPHQTTVLECIRRLGLELEIIFNKGAVMILPTGINKATGLAAALTDCGLAPLNTVAIGDAENDHIFLKACGCGVAVANAIPALKETADIVTEGDHGAGVQQLNERLIEHDLADVP
jgi:HAD superfamily hydrolase (TIGR01484 family)